MLQDKTELKEIRECCCSFLSQRGIFSRFDSKCRIARLCSRVCVLAGAFWKVFFYSPKSVYGCYHCYMTRVMFIYEDKCSRRVFEWKIQISMSPFSVEHNVECKIYIYYQHFIQYNGFYGRAAFTDNYPQMILIKVTRFNSVYILHLWNKTYCIFL